jgi:hypothetical protein
MGVELGKVLAKAILGQLEKPADVKGHDSSVSFGLLLVRRCELMVWYLDDWSDPLLPEVP